MEDVRATCWSITINNPTEADKASIKQVPVPGWVLKGQYEEGKEGTFHYQGMLKTPQVRFAAVKRAYPRAHIEAARSKAALERYVNKEDTRVEVVESESIPTIFQYQGIIAKRWKEDDFQEMVSQFPRKDQDEVAMLYLDSLVAEDISGGQRGAEWIATNPMWRNAWKKFWRYIIKRENGSGSSDGTQPSASSDPGESGSPPV